MRLSILQGNIVSRKSLRLVGLILLMLALGPLGVLQAQTPAHARAVALGGAFTAIPQGVFSVSTNPANLAFPAAYSTYFYLGGLDWQMTNNFYSLLTSAQYGGKDLTADDGRLQKEFIDDLPENGWRMNTSFGLPIPIINFSMGNKAFTTNVLYVTDYYISKPALDIIFGNWQKNVAYETDLRIDAMTAIEYAYSMGIPYQNVAFGFSVKYIQGLGYYGFDPNHSSGLIKVDTVLTGLGDYLFRESNTGMGIGVDLGISYRDKSGLDLGLCIQNIGANIKWNKSALFSEAMGTTILELMGSQVKSGLIRNTDLDLPFEGESYHYQFELNDVTMSEFFEGDSSYSHFFYSKRDTTHDSSVFRTRLPLVLRVGLAKQIRPDLLVSMDFSTSFQDRFNYKKGWCWSIGLEYSYLPKTPFRFGLALGGIGGWEIALGSGLHLGFAHLDWAIGLQRGLWLHTTKGIHFAVSSYFTGKRKS